MDGLLTRENESMAKKQIRTTKREMKKAAIEACADLNGRVRPETLVEAASNPAAWAKRKKRSEIEAMGMELLHGEFEWDDVKAAHQQRINRARQLIREIRFEFVYETTKIVCPYYVSDVTDKTSSYVQTVHVKKKKLVAKETIEDEMRRVKSAVTRAASLAAFFDLMPLFQQMLDTIVQIEGRLDDDGEAA